MLKAPDIPSVLVETAFISNPDEETRLRSDAYQEQLADAIMRGMRPLLREEPAAGAQPAAVISASAPRAAMSARDDSVQSLPKRGRSAS